MGNRRLAGFMVITVLFIISPLLLCHNVFACSCLNISGENPQIWLSKYDEVFTGRVIQIEKPVENAFHVKFKVLKSYKGNPAESLVVFTPSVSAACGYDFIENEDYIVYATSGPDGFWVSLCSPTKKISEAPEDLNALELISSSALN